jgi:hypothetical protein
MTDGQSVGLGKGGEVEQGKEVTFYTSIQLIQ